MKKINRWLSLLICICVLVTPARGNLASALAEELPADTQEEVFVDATAQEGSQEDEEAEPVSGEDLPSDDVVPSEKAENNEAEKTEEQVSATADPAVEEALFDFGYAITLRDAPLYESYKGKETYATVLSDGIMFAAQRRDKSGYDRIQVFFAYEGTEISGWLAASVLEPMSEADVEDFRESAKDAILFYDNNTRYPLSEPDVQMITTSVESESDVEEETEEIPFPETDNDDNIPESVETAVGNNADDPDITEPTVIPEAEIEISSVEMTLRQANAALSVGESISIEPSFSDGAQRKVTFSAEASGIVSIDSDLAIVTAIAPGSTVIHVHCSELSLNAAVEITVVDTEVQENTINPQQPPEIKATLVSDVEIYQTTVVNVENAGDFGDGIVYESSDEQVAIVDAAGSVTAVGAGTCVIIVRSGEAFVELPLTVHPQPLEIILHMNRSVLTVGESEEIRVEFVNCESMEVEYTSSNCGVASIDESGIVTARGVGNCEIYARTSNGMQASVSVTVDKASIVLSNGSYRLAVGQSVYVGYKLDSDLTEMDSVVFSSLNAAVATVDPLTGCVQAVGEGETAIVLTLSKTGDTAQCTVNVCSAPTRVEIVEAQTVIGVKQITEPIEYKLYADEIPTVGNVSFESSNTKVLQVNAEGEMLGVKTGTAYVRISAYNGIADTIKVTVKKAPSKLAISPANAVLAVGQSGQIQYSLNSNTAAGMEFASSDSGIVTVDAAGRVEAVGIGSAKVRVSTHNGLVKYCSITVKKAPENVKLSLSVSKLGVGMEAVCSASVDTDSDIQFIYRYWTDAPEVIAVAETTGLITALSEGTANVFVETYNGVHTHESDGARIETSAKVQVVPKPDHVKIEGEEFNITAGSVITLPVSMTMADGDKDCLTAYTLATSNKKVAQVNDAGRVKGIKTGTATVRLTAQSGHVVDVKINVRSKARKVVLNQSAMALGIGMHSTLQARVYYSSSKYFLHSAEDVQGIGRFVTSDDSVVQIDPATGMLTAVGKGNAVVGYRTVNGKTATCKVTVHGEPTEIRLNTDQLKLGAGMTYALKAVYLENEMGPVSYSSSDRGVAEVDAESGVVRAVAMGTAVITSDAGNGVTDTCEVRVVPKPDHVEIEGTQFNVIVGSTIMLPVKMTMSDGGTDCMTSYTFATSNKKVAQVDDAGQVKGVKTGTAIVRLTAQSGHVVDVKINVRAKAKKVILNQNSLTLGVGMKDTLMAKVYYSSSKYYLHSAEDAQGTGTFVSSNSSVVQVNPATGELTAISKGTALVGYRTVNGKTATCRVTVHSAPTSLKLNTEDLTLGEAMTSKLVVTFNDYEHGLLEFVSSDDSVVSVDNEGRMTAVGAGEAIVTVSTINNISAACRVTVLPGPDEITLNISSSNMAINGRIGLIATATYRGSNECVSELAYRSSNSKVASVTADGIVRGLRAGSAIIRVQAQNGVYADCRIVVCKTPTRVQFEKSTVDLGVGQSVSVAARISFSGGSCLYSPNDTTYARVAVEDPTIAAIDPNTGVITGMEVGYTYLKLATYNGKYAKCLIKVSPGPDWIALEENEITLSCGQIREMECTRSAGSMTTLTYSSSDTKVVRVEPTSKGCRLNAAGKGSAVITATAANGISVACKVDVLEAPQKIQFEVSSIMIGVKESVSLPEVSVSSGGEACDQTVTFSLVGDAAVLGADGTIMGVKAGTATLKAAAFGNLSASCKVTVIPEPSRIKVTAEDTVIAVGSSTKLNVEPDMASGCDFSADNENIVHVAADGTVTARGIGTAVITATAYNGLMAECSITVKAAPEWLQLNVNRITMGAGAEYQLNASVGAGTHALVIYSSSDPDVAVVNESGIIEAVSPGSAQIRASVNGNASVYDVCRVDVLRQPDTLRFADAALSIQKGASAALKVSRFRRDGQPCNGNVTYRSSDPEVVTVDQNGIVRAVGAGEATIIASLASDENITASCMIGVSDGGIGFEVGSLVLGVGEIHPLSIRQTVGDGTLHVESSNPEIAAVNPLTFELSALSVGTATITAMCGGESAECMVHVVGRPDAIELSSSEKFASVGDSFTLFAEFAPLDTHATLDYVSSDESVAVVSNNGLVMAVGHGEATIVVTAAHDLSAACRIIVGSTPTALKVTPAVITACAEDSVRLDVKLGGEEEYAELSYISADSSVASVSSDGMVNFGHTGETEIIVRTLSGLQARIPVKVCEVPSDVSISPAAASILQGDAAQLDISFVGGAAYYTIHSSDDNVLEVSQDGTVRAISPGQAEVTVHVPSLGTQTSGRLTVLESLEGIKLSVEKPTLELNETTRVICTLLPSGTIGTGGVTYRSSDEAVASVDRETGEITAHAFGTAVITAETTSGQTAQCSVNVLGGKRRMLIAYYFGEDGDDGYLPFAYNNAHSVKQVFSAARVEGQKYDIAGPMSNASKNTLLGTIDSHFADATDNDVSLIYICAHGSEEGINGEYAFMLDNNHYVTASELMNRLEKIKGQVVLIMDSCYSGGMIDCNKARLDAQGGRISILTSSHRNTSSCYWNVTQKLTSVDFFTHAFLQGLGFNEAQGIGGNRGWFASDAGPADDSGNNDGHTTITELFGYARSVTVSNIAKLKNQKQFFGNPNQVPKSYIGSMNKDLVLFAR